MTITVARLLTLKVSLSGSIQLVRLSDCLKKLLNNDTIVKTHITKQQSTQAFFNSSFSKQCTTDINEDNDRRTFTLRSSRMRKNVI